MVAFASCLLLRAGVDCAPRKEAFCGRTTLLELDES